MCDLISDSYSYFNGSLSKAALKLGYGWVITTHLSVLSVEAITYLYYERNVGLVNQFLLVKEATWDIS